MRKVTKWFNTMDNPPVRAGWYDVKYGNSTNPHHRRYWWDLRVWRFSKGDIKTAYGNQGPFDDEWRGLAKKP